LENSGYPKYAANCCAVERADIEQHPAKYSFISTGVMSHLKCRKIETHPPSPSLFAEREGVRFSLIYYLNFIQVPTVKL